MIIWIGVIREDFVEGGVDFLLAKEERIHLEYTEKRERHCSEWQLKVQRPL